MSSPIDDDSRSEEPEESLEDRVARLERTLVFVRNELAALRDRIENPPRPPSRITTVSFRRPSLAADIATPAADPASRASSRRAASRRVEGGELERLLGRYGMLAIAVLAAVAAVGTFLSWAIGRGYLRLTAGERVVLGSVFAAGVGAYGLRLRRTERSFGSSLLGLALVIVMVCAYAAGPGLHIVPSSVAFLGAALVSWVLAFFAHAEDDEPLWCVAFGGAVVAPFVTSDGRGSIYALLAYGALVLLPGCFAISHRAWPIGWRVFYLATALFTLAGSGLASDAGTLPFLVSFAFPFAIAAAGVVPFAPATRKRAALRWLALLGVLGSMHGVNVGGADVMFAAVTVVAGMTAWLVLLDRQADVAQSSLTERLRGAPAALDWVDGALLPLLFTARAAVSLFFTQETWPVFGATALLCGIFTWRRPVGSLRDAGAFSCSAASVAVVLAIPLASPLGHIAASVALSLALLAAHKARPSLTWLIVGGGFLMATAVGTAGVLTQRPRYHFTPFATEASAAAMAVLLGFIVVARFWPWLRAATRSAFGKRAEWTYAAELRVLLRSAAAAPWVWAFIWAMIELAMAYSPSTSTLLLVVYFAATAVASVAIGRMRRWPRLRQVGLGLALAAAATAWYGATSYFDFGARIAAYLVTSAFLLGIAYWYRRPGAAVETVSGTS